MRRVFQIISLFLVVIYIFSATIAFAANDVLSIETKDNGDGTYTVNAVLSTNDPVSVLQFGIAYDSDKLKLVDSEENDALSAGFSALNDKQEGYVYFAWANAENVSVKDGSVVLTLTFEGISNGDAKIGFDRNYDHFIADEDSDEIELSLKESSIGVSGVKEEVSSTPKPTTLPTPPATQKPLEGGAIDSPAIDVEPDTKPINPDESMEGIDDGYLDTNDQQQGATVQGNAGEALYLDKYAVALKPEETYQIKVIGGAENASYKWTSSNEMVAVVDDSGLIIAKSVGNAIITVENEELSFRKDIMLTVFDVMQSSATDGLEILMIKNQKGIPLWSWITMGGAVLCIAVGLYFWKKNR